MMPVFECDAGSFPHSSDVDSMLSMIADAAEESGISVDISLAKDLAIGLVGLLESRGLSIQMLPEMRQETDKEQHEVGERIVLLDEQNKPVSMDEIVNAGPRWRVTMDLPPGTIIELPPIPCREPEVDECVSVGVEESIQSKPLTEEDIDALFVRNITCQPSVDSPVVNLVDSVDAKLYPFDSRLTPPCSAEPEPVALASYPLRNIFPHAADNTLVHTVTGEAVNQYCGPDFVPYLDPEANDGR